MPLTPISPLVEQAEEPSILGEAADVVTRFGQPRVGERILRTLQERFAGESPPSARALGGGAVGPILETIEPLSEQLATDPETGEEVGLLLPPPPFRGRVRRSMAERGPLNRLAIEGAAPTAAFAAGTAITGNPFVGGLLALLAEGVQQDIGVSPRSGLQLVGAGAAPLTGFGGGRGIAKAGRGAVKGFPSSGTAFRINEADILRRRLLGEGGEKLGPDLEALRPPVSPQRLFRRLKTREAQLRRVPKEQDVIFARRQQPITNQEGKPLLDSEGNTITQEVVEQVPENATPQDLARLRQEGAELFSERQLAPGPNLRPQDLKLTQATLNRIRKQADDAGLQETEQGRDLLRLLEATESGLKTGRFGFEQINTRLQNLGREISNFEGKGPQVGAAKLLFGNLQRDLGRLAKRAENEGNQELADLLIRAREATAQEQSVQTLRDTLEDAFKFGRGEAERQFDPRKAVNAIEDLVRPGSKKFDRRIFRTIGSKEEFEKVKRLLRRSNELVGNISGAGPGSLVFRGRFAKAGERTALGLGRFATGGLLFGGPAAAAGGAGAGIVAGLVGGLGALAGARAPERIARLLLRPQGRKILERVAEPGGGRFFSQLLAGGAQTGRVAGVVASEETRPEVLTNVPASEFPEEIRTTSEAFEFLKGIGLRDEEAMEVIRREFELAPPEPPRGPTLFEGG